MQKHFRVGILGSKQDTQTRQVSNQVGLVDGYLVDRESNVDCDDIVWIGDIFKAIRRDNRDWQSLSCESQDLCWSCGIQGESYSVLL